MRYAPKVNENDLTFSGASFRANTSLPMLGINRIQRPEKGFKVLFLNSPLISRRKDKQNKIKNP